MAYTNSSLVTYKNLTADRTAPRNHKIDTITIHCYVGQVTAKEGCDYFAKTDRKVSSNYVVGHDGSIGLSVEEQNRAWTSGGKDKNGNPIRVNGISGSTNDHRAVTIEVACDTKHPYAVTDKAMKALIELVADICKRNDIKKLLWKSDKSLVGKVDQQNMTVHRWFSNTACPGDYLYSKHSYIADEVNKKLGATTVVKPKPTPTPQTTPTPTTSLKFKVGDIVNFAGGKHYSSAAAKNGSSVKASKAKVTAISKNSSHPYHVRAVNDKGAFVGGGVYGWVDASALSAITATTTKPATATTSKPAQKSLDDWANEVIAGKHGNGILKRTASLKKAGCPYSYVKVQSRVNALLKKK
jgi:hypothetical protein